MRRNKVTLQKPFKINHSLAVNLRRGRFPVSIVKNNFPTAVLLFVIHIGHRMEMSYRLLGALYDEM